MQHGTQVLLGMALEIRTFWLCRRLTLSVKSADQLGQNLGKMYIGKES
jgi:hypothetical protein